jgi:hypothetical protein
VPIVTLTNAPTDHPGVDPLERAAQLPARGITKPPTDQNSDSPPPAGHTTAKQIASPDAPDGQPAKPATRHQGTSPPTPSPTETPTDTTPRPGAMPPGVAAVYATLVADPALLDRIDGHGGLTTPPEDALKYRPSRGLRAAVFTRYPTCTFPRCTKPSSRCEFEHAIPFDHADPQRGGWTIIENTHPACKHHHQLKTAGHYRVVILPDGAVVWISTTAIIGITVPHGTGTEDTATTTRMRPAWDTTEHPLPTPPPPDSAIDEETWWEHFIGTTPKGAKPDKKIPTLAHVAATTDPQRRAELLELYEHHQTHLAILTQRARYEKPPF